MINIDAFFIVAVLLFLQVYFISTMNESTQHSDNVKREEFEEFIKKMIQFLDVSLPFVIIITVFLESLRITNVVQIQPMESTPAFN